MENTTETTNENINIVTFLDSIGRTILAEKSHESETQLAVKNPVILHIVPDNNGRMSVQLLPIFFREFLADKNEDVIFNYNLNQISKTNIVNFDFRLQAQYKQLFNKSSIFVPPNSGDVVTPSQSSSQPSGRVVNLFDE
jgi:hypothetical protein